MQLPRCFNVYPFEKHSLLASIALHLKSWKLPNEDNKSKCSTNIYCKTMWSKKSLTGFPPKQFGSQCTVWILFSIVVAWHFDSPHTLYLHRLSGRGGMKQVGNPGIEIKQKLLYGRTLKIYDRFQHKDHCIMFPLIWTWKANFI